MEDGCMAEARADTMKQEREEVYVPLQHAASFHCLVEEWKDCEKLSSLSRKKSGLFWTRGVRSEASNRVVRGKRIGTDV